MSTNPKHGWNKEKHINRIASPVSVSYRSLGFCLTFGVSPYGIHKFMNTMELEKTGGWRMNTVREHFQWEVKGIHCRDGKFSVQRCPDKDVPQLSQMLALEALWKHHSLMVPHGWEKMTGHCSHWWTLDISRLLIRPMRRILSLREWSHIKILLWSSLCSMCNNKHTWFVLFKLYEGFHGHNTFSWSLAHPNPHN